MSFSVMFQGGSHIRPSLYSLYIRDWLEVFPRGQFFFIKSEEYYAGRSSVLAELFHFLGLAPLSRELMDKIVSSSIKNPRRNIGAAKDEMTLKTRQMLNDFFSPYSDDLAKLLNDNKFLWKN